MDPGYLMDVFKLVGCFFRTAHFVPRPQALSCTAKILPFLWQWTFEQESTGKIGTEARRRLAILRAEV